MVDAESAFHDVQFHPLNGLLGTLDQLPQAKFLLVDDPVASIGGTVTLVGGTVTLVGGTVTLVGDTVTLVGAPLAGLKFVHSL